MTDSQDFDKLRTALLQTVRDNRRLRNVNAALSQRLIGLRMLQNITLELVSELDVDRLLQLILRSAIEAVEGMAGSLLLLDPSGQELIFSVVEGGGGRALQGQRMGIEQGVAGWAIRNNKPVMVPDVRADERFCAEVGQAVNFDVHSLICVPLATRGQVIGAIQVLNKAHGARFGDDDLDLLTSFAAQSATAIENARLYQDLKRERDRIVAVEEEVRKRLARDLHDGPAQLLASIILSVDFIQKLLAQEPERVAAEVENLLPVSQKALRQVRTLLFDLRPVLLETQGLVPALESYVEQQGEMGDLAYHLQVEDFTGRLVPAAERAIFSIVQEAVGNARKHARASNVWIVVMELDGQLLIRVRDDGCGFDVPKLLAEYDQRGSLGMLNMQERTRAMDGDLTLRSQPGQGTTIILTVPLASLRGIAA